MHIEKFLAVVTRCSVSSVSLRGARKSSRSCESSHRRSGPQLNCSRGIRRRCRIRAGWRHEWIPRGELPSSSVLAIREVVRGPFSSPRLVSASPYVLISSNSRNGGSVPSKLATRCPRIRRGIPDPWAEYLAYRGFCGKEDRRTVKRDLDLGCKNIYVTATVWKDLGLPLGQGIPDPWKVPTGKSQRDCKKDSKLRGEKRQYRESRRCCEYCNGRRTDTRVSLSRTSCHAEQTAVSIDRQKLPQTNENPIAETLSCPAAGCRPVKNAPDNVTVPCDLECRNPCSVLPTNQQAVDLRQKSRRPIESDPNPQRKLTDASSHAALKVPQQRIPVAELSRDARTPDNLKLADVRTTGLFSSNFHQTQTSNCFCKQEEHSTHDQGTSCLPYNHSPQDLHRIGGLTQPQLVRDEACACESRDFGQKRVGFGSKNYPGIETSLDRRKKSLNVTQLPCGCVHVSPCSEAEGCFGDVNGHVGVGRAGFTPPSFKEPSGQKSFAYKLPKYLNPKPKVVSRMKRLFNRCKPRSRFRLSDAKAKAVTASEINVSLIPDEAKLVCCQCSCSYLKIRSVQEEAAPRKKKLKCQCEQCHARRDQRRETRRGKEAKQEEQAWVSPRHPRGMRHSCWGRVQAEPGIAIKCHPENPGNSCRLCTARRELPNGYGQVRDLRLPECKVVTTKGQPDCPSKLQRQNRPCEAARINEKLESYGNSAEVCRYHAPFGAPWYSSDSGENADVSEASRHNEQGDPIKGASAPEVTMVTSCTFISRINHDTVLQCLRERKGSSQREERPKLSGRGADLTGQRRPSTYQTPTPTTDSPRPKIIANQLPLLDLEESAATNDSQPLPSAASIDPPTSLLSSYKDEKTPRASHPTNADKKPPESSGKRMKSRKKDAKKKPNSSTADSSQASRVSRAVPYNRKSPNPPQRKTRSVANDTLRSTGVTDNATRTSDLSRKNRRLKNSANEPNITTIVSPRKISTNSSTNHSPKSHVKKSTAPYEKSRMAQTPTNNLKDGGSSKIQGQTTPGRSSVVGRSEIRCIPGSCTIKYPQFVSDTREAENSSLSHTLSSRSKMEEGEVQKERMGGLDLNCIEEARYTQFEDDTTRSTANAISAKGTISATGNRYSENVSDDRIVTTLVSPRKFSTNSSRSCSPNSCGRKSASPYEKFRTAQAPRNTPTDGGSSDNREQVIPRRNTTDDMSGVPCSPGFDVTRYPPPVKDTREAWNSTPSYTICSLEEADGFRERKRAGSLGFNASIEADRSQLVDETTVESIGPNKRIPLPEGVNGPVIRSSTDSECYLKWCIQRQSGPCNAAYPSRKMLPIKRPSWFVNEDRENGDPRPTGNEVPLGRRAFPSSSDQRTVVTTPCQPFNGRAFNCTSPHPRKKVQDEFNVG